MLKPDPFNPSHENRLVTVVMCSNDPAKITRCGGFQVGQSIETYSQDLRLEIRVEDIISGKTVEPLKIAYRDLIETVETADTDGGTWQGMPVDRDHHRWE
jgi:hypothetical protein